MQAYVGMGGNLGGVDAIRRRFVTVERAVGAWPDVMSVRRSPSYASAPVGPLTAQPHFVNAVLAVELASVATRAAAHALLDRLLALEVTFGRDRASVPAKGPRTLDLDLLLVGELTVDDATLTLPHPALAARVFVLAPLADLVGASFPLPGRGTTVGAALAHAAKTQEIQLLGL